MTTLASNAKFPVTQNRIGKLKKRINQIKIGNPKKDVRKQTHVFEDESAQVSKCVNNRKMPNNKIKQQPQGQPRQPLRNIQPNVNNYLDPRVYRDPDPRVYRDPDPRLYRDPERCQAETYRNDTYATYRPYSEHDDYVTSDPYWQTGRSDVYYEDECQERKAVGIVPPCPVGESDIDLQSLGRSIVELFPSCLPTKPRHSYLHDWYHPDEYRDDVINYVMEQDRLYTIKSVGFLYNGDIQINMRTILIDWLIQVQVHQDLLDETLHLTAALIDRYHSQHVISLSKYQLLGVGCLFLAAKYCERFPPLIVDLVKLTENTYTPDQLLNMELKILAVLQFDLTFVDPHSLMERYLHVFGYHKDKMVRYLSMYLIDLSLLEHRCIVFRRATLVMNAVCLAKMILDETAQYHLMPHCKPEITRTLAFMLIQSETAEQTAVKVKYSSMSRYHGISHLPSITTSPIVTSLASEMTSYQEPKPAHVRFV